MTLRAATLALLALLTNTALAEDIADLPLSECNVERSWTIDSPALGETVELTVNISVDEQLFQDADFTLTLSDGKVLGLGEGGKYFDELGWGPDPTCGELIDKATAVVRASLLGERVAGESPYDRTLSDLHAESVSGRDCMKTANRLPGEAPSPECMALNRAHLAFVKALEAADMLPHTYLRLRDDKAPLVVVRRSTYYDEYYIWDAMARDLILFMAQGC